MYLKKAKGMYVDTFVKFLLASDLCDWGLILP
jgi:hypothetical protein